MADDAKQSSWWHTLPGVLTAVAAVVTAVGGLIAVLVQSGIIGARGEGPSAEAADQQPAATATVMPGPQDSTAIASAPAPDPVKPWQDTQAVIHLRDGAMARVRASSLSHCISVSHEIEIDGAQSIPFERMRSLEVLRADEYTVPNASAHVVVELLDGTRIEGAVPAVCDLFGYNDVGRFSVYFSRLASIRFER